MPAPATTYQGGIGTRRVDARWPNETNGILLTAAFICPDIWRASTDCESIAAAKSVEMPFPAYEMSRNSGALSFWDEPEEDVYSFGDGEPV